MRTSATDDRTVTAVLGAIVDNIQDLVRTEARLATTELSEEVGKAARPVGSIALGAALAFYGVGFFLVAAAILLSRVLEVWASTALIGTLVSAGSGRTDDYGPAGLEASSSRARKNSAQS